jgi:hypothetical protein
MGAMGEAMGIDMTGTVLQAAQLAERGVAEICAEARPAGLRYDRADNPKLETDHGRPDLEAILLV